VATALPMQDDLSVDFDAYATHVRWLADNGCHGVAPNGSLGEYPTLTPAERRRVVEVAVEAAPEGFTVMRGVGAYGALESRRCAEEAAEAGAQVLMALPPNSIPANFAEGSSPLSQAIWLYGDDEHQLVELVRHDGGETHIRVIPVARLRQSKEGRISWTDQAWGSGFPLRLFEDPNLAVPDASGRAAWLSAWHSEREWFQTIHRCRYSNGVIGVTEHLLPPSQALPANAGMNPLLQKFELRRRQLVQADFHIFATDHWNFNVRNFNPGGNHGSFLRISTHSVWMMAGPSVPRGRHIREPYDSLNFASTLLACAGKQAPMPDRVVDVKR